MLTVDASRGGCRRLCENKIITAVTVATKLNNFVALSLVVVVGLSSHPLVTNCENSSAKKIRQQMLPWSLGVDSAKRIRCRGCCRDEKVSLCSRINDGHARCFRLPFKCASCCLWLGSDAFVGNETLSTAT